MLEKKMTLSTQILIWIPSLSQRVPHPQWNLSSLIQVSGFTTENLGTHMQKKKNKATGAEEVISQASFVRTRYFLSLALYKKKE